MKKSKTIVLAAGQGTRMRSERPKVLFQICGKTILDWVIDASVRAGVEDIAVIVGYKADAVKETLPESMRAIYQKDQLGTGHAVIQALPFFDDLAGNVIVLVGDAPLIRPETIAGLMRNTKKKAGAQQF